MSVKPKYYFTPFFIAILILMLCVIILPASAADNDYRQIPVQKNINVTKEKWTFQFTLPIDKASVNDANIYIVNKSNQRHDVELKLSNDQKVLYIIPQKAYEYNSTYRLYLENGICSNTNPVAYLTQKTIMTFTTIKDEKAVPDAPQISLNINNQTITGSSDKHTLLLKGSVNQTAHIKINGEKVITSNNSFSKEVRLSAGDNKIEVVATDDFEQVTTKIVTIKYLIKNNTTVDDANGGSSGNIVEDAENITQIDNQTLDDLKVVSSKLVNAINQLTDQDEKSIAQDIKTNIDNKIADPNFDHTAQIPEIINKYGSLTSDQKDDFQNVILYNIPVQRLLRLAEYFGFK